MRAVTENYPSSQTGFQTASTVSDNVGAVGSGLRDLRWNRAFEFRCRLRSSRERVSGAAEKADLRRAGPGALREAEFELRATGKGEENFRAQANVAAADPAKPIAVSG